MRLPYNWHLLPAESMSTESEDFRRAIQGQLADFRQLAAERTEQILATIARHHELRDKFERRLVLLEESVSCLKTRVTNLENPDSDAA